MEAALEEVGKGRRGKGCPLFFSTGNENTHVDYPATSPHAIAVGASTYKEKRAHYSNRGRTVSIVAPSGVVTPVSGVPGRAISPTLAMASRS